MKITLKQVDAFTLVPLTGNPAGVVMKADGLTPQQMQVIAREMAVPETAFILPASTPSAWRPRASPRRLPRFSGQHWRSGST